MRDPLRPLYVALLAGGLCATGCGAPADDTAGGLTSLGADASAESFTTTGNGFMVNWQLSGPWTSSCSLSVADTATLNGYVGDGSIASTSEFNSSAAVLTAKLQYVLGGAAPALPAVCNQMLSALAFVPRQGDCPEYYGNAVRTTNIAMTNAMNYVQDTYAPTAAGKWCKVSLLSTAATDPQNLYFSLIYAFQNYTAASVVHLVGSAPAVYRLRYFVPQSAANAYASFLANPSLAAAYPTGSTFSLGLQNTNTAENGVISTSLLTINTPEAYTIVDPDASSRAIESLDQFVDAQVDEGVSVSDLCVMDRGFSFRPARSIALPGFGRLQLQGTCR